MADADFVVPVGVPDIKYVNFYFLFFFLQRFPTTSLLNLKRDPLETYF